MWAGAGGSHNAAPLRGGCRGSGAEAGTVHPLPPCTGLDEAAPTSCARRDRKRRCWPLSDGTRGRPRPRGLLPTPVSTALADRGPERGSWPPAWPSGASPPRYQTRGPPSDRAVLLSEGVARHVWAPGSRRVCPVPPGPPRALLLIAVLANTVHRPRPERESPARCRAARLPRAGSGDGGGRSLEEGQRRTRVTPALWLTAERPGRG